MTSTIEIRSAKAEDLPVMKAIIEANGLFPAEMLDEMTSAYFNAANTTEMWFVALSSQLTGLIYCAPERMTEGTWNVYLIAVDPANQGHGVGAALMDHVETLLADRGERIILVETSGQPEFKRTRQFYLKIGYTLEARIRAFYSAGEDKIVFHKTL